MNNHGDIINQFAAVHETLGKAMINVSESVHIYVLFNPSAFNFRL